MPPPLKDKIAWYRQPYFWLGWLASGMVCPLAFGLTMTANSQPFHWEINIGYAFGSLPPIVAAVIAHRRQRREMQRIREEIEYHAKNGDRP